MGVPHSFLGVLGRRYASRFEIIAPMIGVTSPSRLLRHPILAHARRSLSPQSPDANVPSSTAHYCAFPITPVQESWEVSTFNRPPIVIRAEPLNAWYAGHEPGIKDGATIGR